jgi:hypothetical protein
MVLELQAYLPLPQGSGVVSLAAEPFEDCVRVVAVVGNQKHYFVQLSLPRTSQGVASLLSSQDCHQLRGQAVKMGCGQLVCLAASDV